MNNSQKINLKSDCNLPWYTISTAVKTEASFIRTGSAHGFAIVNLEVQPHPNKQVAIFSDRIAEINCGTVLYSLKNSDRDTIEILEIIVSGIVRGIEKACLDLEQKSYLVGGIEIIVTSAKFHPINSRFYCYERAVHLALLKIFEESNLIEV